MSLEKTASIHQKQPPQKYAFLYWGISPLSFEKRSERPFTQNLVFLSVIFSPTNTCHRCPWQFLQVISVLRPSASSFQSTLPGIASSKAGHPHPASNFVSDRKSGALHCRQRKTPVSYRVSYGEENGGSVHLLSITFASSVVSSLYHCVIRLYKNSLVICFYIKDLIRDGNTLSLCSVQSLFTILIIVFT